MLALVEAEGLPEELALGDTLIEDVADSEIDGVELPLWVELTELVPEIDAELVDDTEPVIETEQVDEAVALVEADIEIEDVSLAVADELVVGDAL